MSRLNARLSGSRRFAVIASALAVAVALGAPATAFADAQGPSHGQNNEKGAHHGRHGHGDHHGGAHLVTRALALTSLNAAQRSQIEALAQEEKANHVTAHAARAKVLTTLAGQVDRGAIDRAGLAPALKDETDAMVAARLRQRSIAERLHVVLTAKQCEEVGGGKDFLHPAKPESEIRAHAQKHAGRMIEHLEKKVPTASADERAKIAAHLRARAAR